MKEKQVLFEGKYYAVPEGDDYMARNFDGAIFSYPYKPIKSEVSKIWILPDNFAAGRVTTYFIDIDTKPVKSWRDSLVYIGKANESIQRYDDSGAYNKGSNCCVFSVNANIDPCIYNRKIYKKAYENLNHALVTARKSARIANLKIRALLNGEFNR